MSRHKLLLVSYLFPPAGGIAVQRALSLAKYLPENGFEVHVLKAWNAAVPVMDESLLRHVPPSVRVHEAFAPELPFRFRHALWNFLGRNRKHGESSGAQTGTPAKKPWMQRAIQRVLCPEPEVLWAPFAIRKARDIIREFGIQTLMITAPPFSAFLVGNALKREFPHLQLISDFRDEWLDFYLNDIDFQGGEYTKKRASQMERETVELSDCIVAVTPSSLERIRRRYPDQPDDKFACVYNGFDPDTFQGFTRQPHGLPKVVVTHLGTAYKTASPRYYLDALDEMPEPMRSAIETRFIGRATDAELAILRSSKSPVDVIGFLPQAEALRRVEETDYLLLTMTNDISLPGKLFEYLAVGKPILALCSRGSETERILKLTQAGVTAEHTDRQAIQNMLAKAYESAMKGVPLCRGDRSEISKFERPRLAAQYGLLIQGLLERDRRPGREAAHQRTC